MTTLDSSAVARFVAASPAWRFCEDRGGVIERSFVFDSFLEAFAFMTRVALIAERLGHHPEWRNVYNRVDVLLTTHDAGGLSDKDVALSRMIDRLEGACASRDASSLREATILSRCTPC